MSSITEYLTEDHRRLHELLDRSDADGIDDESFAAFRAGLLRHIGIEEKILLPRREAMPRRPARGSNAPACEHAALTSHLVPSPDRALIAEIRWLLNRHDAREEEPRFPRELGRAACGVRVEFGRSSQGYARLRITYAPDRGDEIGGPLAAGVSRAK